MLRKYRFYRRGGSSIAPADVREFLTSNGTDISGSFEALTITADCVINAKATNNGATGIRPILGHSDDTDNRIYFEGENLKAVFAGGAVHDFGETRLDRLLSIEITRTGAEWTATVNGEILGLTYTAAGNVALNRVAASSGGAFLIQAFSDIGVFAPTDGINIYWKMDQGIFGDGAFELNSNDYLRSELIVNGMFDSDISGWTGSDAGSTLSWQSGELRIENGDASAAGANRSLSVVSGETYVIALSSTQNTATTAGIQFGIGLTANSFNKGSVTDTFNGDHYMIFTADATGTWYFMAQTLSTVSGEYIQIDNVTIRQALNPLTLNNVGSSDWETFRFNGSWLWLSLTDLLQNTDFDTDTVWTKGTGWTIAGGVADSDGAQVSDSDLEQIESRLIEGATYEFEYSSTNLTSGVHTPVIGSVEGIDHDVRGSGAETILAGSTADVALRANSEFIGQLDTIRLRRSIVTNSRPNASAWGPGWGW